MYEAMKISGKKTGMYPGISNSTSKVSMLWESALDLTTTHFPG